MSLRAIRESDIEQLRRIHKEHFGTEYGFNEFFDHALMLFVYEEDDKIISAGSVRTIVEACTITDKDATKKERHRAFMEILRASLLTCGIHKYHELHAFIQDPRWYQILQKMEFKPTVGQALVKRV